VADLDFAEIGLNLFLVAVAEMGLTPPGRAVPVGVAVGCVRVPLDLRVSRSAHVSRVPRVPFTHVSVALAGA